MKLTLRLKGGEGSGFRDHKGIPGHQGGSLPESELGKFASEELMSKQEVISDVKRQLKTIKGNLNSWSYRDRAKLVINHVYGGGDIGS